MESLAKEKKIHIHTLNNYSIDHVFLYSTGDIESTLRCHEWAGRVFIVPKLIQKHATHVTHKSYTKNKRYISFIISIHLYLIITRKSPFFFFVHFSEVGSSFDLSLHTFEFEFVTITVASFVFIILFCILYEYLFMIFIFRRRISLRGSRE